MPNTLLRRLIRIFAVMFIVIATAYADDTEIFFSKTLPYSPYATTGDIAPPNPNYPNILFVLDASQSMSFFDGGSTSRITRLREAMDLILTETNRVNIGVMRFSHSNSGGRIIYPMSPIEFAREDAIEAINTMSIDWKTPTVGAILESAYYWTGAPVYYGTTRAAEYSHTHVRVHQSRVSHPDSYTGGVVVREDECTDDNLNHPSCENERIDGDPVYIAPILGECQSNYQIVISDGGATGGVSHSRVNALTKTDCAGSGSNSCGPELAHYMANTDLAPNVPGTNTVTTHTIGFNSSLPPLENIALAGGGRYFESSSSGELVEVLSSVLVDAIGAGQSFAAPALSLDQSTRLAHRDDIYLALFQPTNSARWPGNLKRYRFDGNIKDRNNQVAVDPDTGNFSDEAQSYWTEGSADGANVELGGAAALLDIADRRVYTYKGQADLTAEVNRVSEQNDLITAAILGVPDSQRDALLEWARGVDVDDVSIGETRLEMGDPLHSRPTVLTYAQNDEGPDSVIFVGTNEGYLHAINSQDGKEVFSFIPPQLLGNLHILRQNPHTNVRTYGLDGDLTLWVNDADGAISGDDHAYLYMGMRRGGRNYTALNVTQKSNPQYMWSIDGGDTGFDRLGQTWSKPTLGKMIVEGEATTVLIFGGGYDPLQDHSTIRSADTTGNDLFIVNAETGLLIWSASGDTADYPAMQYSIPSDPAVLDADGDGFTDQIYIGDMGGQVWRFDIDNGTAATAVVTGGVIADLGGNSPEENRRFFYRPDLTLVADGHNHFLSVAIGSGNRANPLREIVTDRFYMIRQHDIFRAPEGYGVIDEDKSTANENIYRAMNEDEIYDATENLLGSSDVDIVATAQAELVDKQGWYITLPSSGEKVLASSITVDNQVVFSTYVPQTPEDPCAAALGLGRVYTVSVLNATPTGGHSTEDRYVELVNPGIPAEPAAHIAGDGDIDIIVGTESFDGPDVSLIRRVYWSEVP